MIALRIMKVAENSEQFCKYAKILMTKINFFEAIWFVHVAQTISNENKNNKPEVLQVCLHSVRGIAISIYRLKPHDIIQNNSENLKNQLGH